MSDNRIGILFNAPLLRGLIRGKTKHEAILFYEEAARQNGIIPCFFRIEDVNTRRMEVAAYVKGPTGYVRRRMPIPRVIHNRAIYLRPTSRARIRSLVQTNIILFNEVNRYGKMSIHNVLKADHMIAPHLPDTTLATRSSIARLMERYDAIVLKPNNSSIGRGLTKIERTSKGWRTNYMLRTSTGGRKWRTVEMPEGKLPASVKSQMLKKAFLVQQLLPLACYKGRPFDLRVSVQRDGTGEWKITGIVGKVAPSHTFVTNVAQGGTVYPFELLAASALPYIPLDILRERISRFSLDVASRLSHTLPHLADLGLDIGISPDGIPLFIECNGRDQRYSFREANLLECWRATYVNPIAYGASLLRQASQ
ncbi:hypothetical protein BBG47_09265 [Paenibacillus sp. KS1]|uniref:YheC/YheD family endospore coat-associated protein n=1 Tax=Paenibacillus sp. KS1 TaxID=1849249 RepID=UPI0008066177|nr:YheC/YheD family protein [Paenibacillus sp. KS1]OBY79804.1 hypothetical protein BBG47_09265 [Paenibacillus sp. KS1]